MNVPKEIPPISQMSCRFVSHMFGLTPESTPQSGEVFIDTRLRRSICGKALLFHHPKSFWRLRRRGRAAVQMTESPAKRASPQIDGQSPAPYVPTARFCPDSLDRLLLTPSRKLHLRTIADAMIPTS